MKSEDNNRSVGIRWTYREVLRGKSGNILAIEVGVILALSGILALLYFAGGKKVPTVLAQVVTGLLALKPKDLAEYLCLLVVIFIPVILVLWPFTAGVLTLFYNLRDRKLPRTEENLVAHEIESERAWTWPWSILIGAFDFTALYFSLDFTIISLANFTAQGEALANVVAMLVSLIFAERRVTRTSCAMAALLPGNRDVLEGILSGEADSYLAESQRNELGRAKVATVIHRGVVRTPHWASIISMGIDVRTKVKLWSGFLNSTIHGVLCALSFGIAANVANSLGNVGGQFAAGEKERYRAELLERPARKPYFIVEFIALGICIAYTIGICILMAGEYAATLG